MQVQTTLASPDARRADCPRPQGEAAAAPPRDRVDLGSGPRLMVGAPTGRLSPQIVPPQRYTTPVALEIDRGIGISLDGEALVVGHDAQPGRIQVIGHLEDGTFPQRDFTIERDGRLTVIDGYYDWQDYRITNEGNATTIDGETPREDSTVRDEGRTTTIDNAFAAGRYVIEREGNEARVDCEWNGDDYRVTTEGDVTRIEGPHEERTFEVTRFPDGRITVKGHYRFQDFEVTPDENGFTIQGLYPQQKFQVVYG